MFAVPRYEGCSLGVTRQAAILGIHMCFAEYCLCYDGVGCSNLLLLLCAESAMLEI
jgi:hypothetical protein